MMHAAHLFIGAHGITSMYHLSQRTNPTTCKPSPRQLQIIARPFDAHFSDIEARIAHYLKSKRIRARAYQPEGGQGYIIDEIQKQISHSHFCIADLTGLKPNVMAEVGMMMVLKKHLLLLRKKGDSATIPFDVSHLQLYEYQTRPTEAGLQVWNVADSRFESFDVVLDKFVQRLPPETGFFSAPPAY